MSTVDISTLSWGLVLDRQGNGRVGVPYSITSGAVPVLSGTTNADGQIEGQLATGRYTLSLPGESYTVDVVAGDEIAMVRAGAPISARDAPYNAIGDGATDDTAALQAAIVAARSSGRELYIPAGTYRITGSLTGAETTPLRVRGAGKGHTILEHDIAGSFMFGGAGTAGFNVAVVADAGNVAGTQTLKVASTSTLAAGGFVLLRDPSQPVLNEDTGLAACALGERAIIKSVDAGTQTLTFWGAKEYSYTTATLVQPITPISDYSISDLTIRNSVAGSGGSGARAIKVERIDKLRIRNVEFYGLDDDAIRMTFCTNFRIEGVDGYDMRSELGNTPYLIAVGEGCSHGVIQSCTLRRGWHLVTSGAGANVDGISPAHVLVSNCVGHDCVPTPFDTHPDGARRWIFANCIATTTDTLGGFPPVGLFPVSGFQVRGFDCLLVNPMASGCNVGIHMVYGHRNRVIGGDLFSCDQGILINGSVGAEVKGTRIINPRVNAIEVKNTFDVMTQLKDVKLRDIDIYGNPSGPAILFTEWDDTYEVSNSDIRAYDATTKFSGALHQTLYGASLPDAVRFELLARREVQTGSLAPFTSGTLYLVGIDLPKGELISKLSLYLATAGTTVTNFWMGLYDRNRNRLALTADSPGTVAAGAMNTLNLTAPYRTTYGGLHYMAIMFAAATPPSVRGMTASNVFFGPPTWVGTSTTGLTVPAGAPNPAAALTTGTIVPYGGAA